MKAHVKCCPYCDGLVYICEADCVWRCTSCTEEWSFEETGWEKPLKTNAWPHTKLQRWIAKELKDSYGRQNNLREVLS